VILKNRSVLRKLLESLASYMNDKAHETEVITSLINARGGTDIKEVKDYF